jgi:hypothetical protein
MAAPLTLLVALSLGSPVHAARMIVSGERWTDTAGSPIEAHGGSIWQDATTKLYHWVGETRKGTPPQRNEGVGLYSSPDLVAWTNHGNVLPMAAIQAVTSKDAAWRSVGGVAIIERPKLAYNAPTKKWVLYTHLADKTYEKYAAVGVATADAVTGPYTFLHTLEPFGGTEHDLGMFRDTNGTVFLLCGTHLPGVDVGIAAMSEDYTTIASQKPISALAGSLEAPAMARGPDGALYFVLSLKTGYRNNAGAQYTSTTGLHGPWIHNGAVSPTSNSTFESQSTYMLELTAADGSSKWMYMGDRWLNPDGAHAAYVWAPALMTGTHKLDIQFHGSWDLDKYLNSDFYETQAGFFNLQPAATKRRQLGTCPSAFKSLFNLDCGNARKASKGDCLLCLSGQASFEGYARDCASTFDAWCSGNPPPPPPAEVCDCGYYPDGEGCSQSGGGCGCMGVGYCNVGGHCTKIGACPGGR